jgi:hypothetical protein
MVETSGVGWKWTQDDADVVGSRRNTSVTGRKQWPRAARTGPGTNCDDGKFTHGSDLYC